MHPDLKGTVLASGHHGYTHIDLERGRVILDTSGGEAGRRLEALILPEGEIVGHEDAVGDCLSELEKMLARMGGESVPELVEDGGE